MNSFYVYCLFRPDTGHPFYVGKGKLDRMESHYTRRRAGNSQRDNIIRKAVNAGLTIPAIKLAVDLDEKQAFAIEKLFISVIGRYPDGPLVNKTDGGEGVSGHVHNAETLAKMSAAKLGKPGHRKGKKHTSETIQRLSDANRGKSSPNKNKKMSYEQKHKLSLAHQGKQFSAERKANHSAALLSCPRPSGPKPKKISSRISARWRAILEAETKGSC